MAKAIVLDGASGISGDMTVAALLDLGANEERLREALTTLPVDGFEVVVSRVEKSGLAACDFNVVLDEAHKNHDHDMVWLYGHEEAVEHCHEHEHSHDGNVHGHCREHDHQEDHGHSHEHHPHVHRTLADVTAIIESSQLTDRAKQKALAIFGKLAQAEAKAHGATPDTVHFHEVGAVDSIVDICSVAICLDNLGVDQLIVPSLSEGYGAIRCAHGVMPIPVPAVAHLCADASITLDPAPVHGELVTPTGAAIVAALRTGDKLTHGYRILSTGYGAGKRTYKNSSGLLRATLIETEDVAAAPADDDPTVAHPVVELKCDLDDCTGEALGRTIELLMAAGAREAHAVPIVMKKGRPAYQLEVICDESNEAQLRDLIFMNTTTIGIRAAHQLRYPLRREPGTVPTPYGEVATKRVVLPDGTVRAYPEYDSVVAACERSGASFQDVFRAVEVAAAPAVPRDPQL